MIEDALGLKVYQWKKLESLRKLERTDENMKQVESLRREIAPHIRFLKKQVEKVEKAEELRKELIVLYKEYFASEELYINTEKQKTSEGIAGPKKELAELDLRLEQAKKILTDSKNKDTKSDKLISLEEKLKICRSEKDTITRELGRLEGELRANKRSIEKEQARIKDEELRMVRLKDVEEVVQVIEGMDAITDVKKLWSEIIGALRGFIAKHRSSVDSALISEAEKDIASLSGERGRYEAKLKDATEKEAKFVREYEELKSTIEKEKDTNREAEKDVFKIIARQNEVRHILETLTAAINVLAREEENFKHELGEAGVIVGREATEYSHGAIESRSMQEERRKKIEKNKIRLEDAGGSGGSEVMKEYRETEERDAFLGKELEDLEKAKQELVKMIADLDARIDYEFKSGILKINTEFQKFFTLMFGGGKAELTVVREARRKRKSDGEDLSDVLSSEDLRDAESGSSDAETEDGPEGIEVNVSLPRKKVKGLMMLSGGERALTSIALLFAVSQVNPPPFIILDETDAALDEANSKKYGDMIENLSKHSQLILITHNRETMARAGVLYGVTMGSDGASKLLSIAFEEAVAVAK